MPTAIPITIRGRTYPSRTAATKALKITNAKLQLALARGTVNAIITPPPLKSVTVRGQYFKSVAICAAHFNVNISTVYTAIRNEYPDGIGLGRGKRRKPNV